MRTVKYICATLLTFLLAAVFNTLGFAFGLLYGIWKGSGSSYIYNVLVAIDQSGNVVCSTAFNLIWLKKKQSRHLFGNPDETISSVLGKNKLDGTLTGFGRLIARLLNFIQKNHVENSIEQKV